MHVAGLFLTLSAFVASAVADVTQGTPCPTMPPMPTGTNETCKLLMNHDRPGFDLKAVKGPLKSCREKCEDASGCRTWAWSDYEGGTCWLKAKASAPVDKVGVWTTECEIEEPSLETCKPLKDVDFEGNNLGYKPAKHFGQCCGICTAYAGCKAYAWNAFNGGTCWLKGSVGAVVHKLGVVSSSILPMETTVVCPFEFDTDFVGNDIGNKPAKDAGECCSICKGDKDCKAYSWSKFNSGTCWMKSGKGKAMKATGVVSAKLVAY